MPVAVASAEDERQSLQAALKAFGLSTRRHRQVRGDSFADWQGLLCGRWSLVQAFDSDGRRFLLARRNPPGAQHRTAVAPLEAYALVLRAQGMSYKLVAHELGVSLAAAHRLVATGKNKLGIVSETELALLLRASGYSAIRDSADTAA